MDLKKQVQSVHTEQNEQFRKKYPNTQNTRPSPPLDEYDILFKEVTFQPNPFIFMPQTPAIHHRGDKLQVKVDSCRLSNKAFEDCFIVDIT